MARWHGWWWAALFLVLAGCGQQEHFEQSGQKIHVGVVLSGEARTVQVQGFLDGLAERGYGEGVLSVTVLNAENDRKRLAGFVRRLVTDGVDLLAVAGGLEADAAREVLADRGEGAAPVVVLYVNAVLERRLIQDRRNPGWRVTGVDNLNGELSGKRLELLHTLLPTARKVLILYYPTIAPAVKGVESARQAAASFGMEIDARPVQSVSEIRKVMEGLAPGEADAMLIVPCAPVENLLSSVILPRARKLALPVMGLSRAQAEAGTLASYGADFYEMGGQAARLAVKIFKGIPVEDIPFEVPRNLWFCVNRSRLAELGLDLSLAARSQVDRFVDSVAEAGL